MAGRTVGHYGKVEKLNAAGMVSDQYTSGLGVDEPLVGQRPSKTIYYEADGWGSITTNTDPGGDIVNSYTTDSFGVVTAHTSPVQNWYVYTARELEVETGLYYYRATTTP
jgi:hypothetical protein